MAEVGGGQPWEQLKLTWETRREAPCRMVRDAAVAHGSLAYFSSKNSYDVFAYNLENNDWSELPECPQSDFGLAVVNNLVTAVGGVSGGQCTNHLSNYSGGRWVTVFPPMPTKRRWPAVISAENYLIAAGGLGMAGRSPVHSGDNGHEHSRVVHCCQPTRTCLPHVSHCLWRASLPPGRVGREHQTNPCCLHLHPGLPHSLMSPSLTDPTPH